MMCPCRRHWVTLWDSSTTLTIFLPRLGPSLISSNMMWDNSSAVCSDTTHNWAPSHHHWRNQQRGDILPVVALSQTWSRCGKAHRVHRIKILLRVVPFLHDRVGEYVLCPSLLPYLLA